VLLTYLLTSTLILHTTACHSGYISRRGLSAVATFHDISSTEKYQRLQKVYQANCRSRAV